MYVDSHCHLSFPGTRDTDRRHPRRDGRRPGRPGAVHLHHAGGIRDRACAGDALRQLLGQCRRAPRQRRRARADGGRPASRWPRRPRVVAIGETGLDYYRLDGPQHRRHGLAARALPGPCPRRAAPPALPLVVHTRSASRRHAGHPARGGRRAQPVASFTASPRPWTSRAPRSTWVSTSRSRAS